MSLLITDREAKLMSAMRNVEEAIFECKGYDDRMYALDKLMRAAEKYECSLKSMRVPFKNDQEE